ncbi:coiled-coil domain-containing protein 149-like [Arapaima gigas]
MGSGDRTESGGVSTWGRGAAGDDSHPKVWRDSRTGPDGDGCEADPPVCPHLSPREIDRRGAEIVRLTEMQAASELGAVAAETPAAPLSGAVQVAESAVATRAGVRAPSDPPSVHSSPQAPLSREGEDPVDCAAGADPHGTGGEEFSHCKVGLNPESLAQPDDSGRPHGADLRPHSPTEQSDCYFTESLA